MPGLKRRLVNTSRSLDDTRRDHQQLLQAHARLMRDHDQIIALLVALGRQSQERTLIGKPLRVSKKLAYDALRTKYHIQTTEDDDGYITITVELADPVVEASSATH